MPRIVHIITDLDTGGAERMLARLVAASHGARFDHHVIALIGQGRQAEAMRAAGVPVWALGLSGAAGLPLSVARLAVWLRRLRPDVVQTWLYHADLVGTLAAALAGGPSLLWSVRCSDMDFQRYAASTALVVRLLARLSGWPDMVVANAEAGRERHVALGYRPRRWRIIPNGVDVAAYRPDPRARATVRRQLGVGEGAPVVGVVARRDPMKDHATFLEAAGRVAGRMPAPVFVLAGRGVTAEAPEVRTAPPALAGRLHALGEHADVPRLMAGLDLLVLPSLYGEGFPNVVAEAMACGVPAVVTDVGDAAHIVGETGRVVPPGDADALADAMVAMLGETEAERARRGQAARQRITANWSLESTVAAFEDLYREVLAGD